MSINTQGKFGGNAKKKAQYKGFGTINGSSNYRLLLTAIDGDQPGGSQDKFRIKIWSKVANNRV